MRFESEQDFHCDFVEGSTRAWIEESFGWVCEAPMRRLRVGRLRNVTSLEAMVSLTDANTKVTGIIVNAEKVQVRDC